MILPDVVRISISTSLTGICCFRFSINVLRKSLSTKMESALVFPIISLSEYPNVVRNVLFTSINRSSSYPLIAIMAELD